MKLKRLSPVLALAALGVTFAVQAHDPKEHMKNAENPNCAVMKDMDHSKMDMDDPVMQAMMKQCMKDMNHGEGEHSKSREDDHKKASEEQHSGLQH
jgi:uncharacterized protein involved in copper resistance